MACSGFCLTHRSAEWELCWSSGHLGSFDWHSIIVLLDFHWWSHTGCGSFELYIQWQMTVIIKSAWKSQIDHLLSIYRHTPIQVVISPGGLGDACVLLLPNFWFFLMRSSKDWNSSSELPVSSRHPLCVDGAEEGLGVWSETRGEGKHGAFLGLFSLAGASFSCEDGRLFRVLHVLLITMSLSSSESPRNTGESKWARRRFSDFRLDLGVFSLAVCTYNHHEHFCFGSFHLREARIDRYGKIS